MQGLERYLILDNPKSRDVYFYASFVLVRVRGKELRRRNRGIIYWDLCKAPTALLPATAEGTDSST